MVKLSPQFILELDIESNVTFANQHAFTATGYAPEDLDKGLNLLQMLIPEDRRTFMENWSVLVSKGKSAGDEYTVQRKDGSTFPIITYGSSIISDGKTAGFRCIAVDITERKRAEEQLERSFVELAETTSRAMACRDPYTEGHQSRLAAMLRLLT